MQRPTGEPVPLRSTILRYLSAAELLLQGKVPEALTLAKFTLIRIIGKEALFGHPEPLMEQARGNP